MQLFPNEVISHTAESLIYRRNKGSKIIYIVAVLMVFSFLALLPIIEVDISIQNRGIIRPKSDPTPITSIISGRVIKNRLQENATVVKGDTLLVINSGTLDAESHTTTDQLTDIYASMRDINKLASGQTQVGGFETGLYTRAWSAYKAGLAELDNRYDQAKRTMERTQSLYNQKVTSLVSLEKTQFELNLAEQAKEQYIEERRGQWQAELKDLNRQRQQLTGTLNRLKAEKTNYAIIAESDGSITRYNGIKTNTFITAGSAVAYLVPDEELLVECYVKPADIGFLKEEMPMRFQMDAFNYRQWGMASGSITEISQNVSYQDNGSPFFRILCHLNEQELTLKNGFSGNLKKDMTLTARATITRRSLFDLLHDKVDDWFNPKIL